MTAIRINATPRVGLLAAYRAKAAAPKMVNSITSCHKTGMVMAALGETKNTNFHKYYTTKCSCLS